MRQLLKDLVCAWLGHEKRYIKFGETSVPYSCSRCGRMWSQW